MKTIFSSSSGKHKSSIFSFVFQIFLVRIWRPDTYFINGKDSFLHKVKLKGNWTKQEEMYFLVNTPWPGLYYYKFLPVRRILSKVKNSLPSQRNMRFKTVRRWNHFIQIRVENIKFRFNFEFHIKILLEWLSYRF